MGQVTSRNSDVPPSFSSKH